MNLFLKEVCDPYLYTGIFISCVCCYLLRRGEIRAIGAGGAVFGGGAAGNVVRVW